MGFTKGHQCWSFFASYSALSLSEDNLLMFISNDYQNKNKVLITNYDRIYILYPDDAGSDLYVQCYHRTVSS